mmetsp:Transcript_48950/g.124662  ORF Transcript_48950/g.124662 Transcript_48950/m.124662 type:complete len:252 (+) Transcript_48950:706-1461(+)
MPHELLNEARRNLLNGNLPGRRPRNSSLLGLQSRCWPRVPTCDRSCSRPRAWPPQSCATGPRPWRVRRPGPCRRPGPRWGPWRLLWRRSRQIHQRRHGLSRRGLPMRPRGQFRCGNIRGPRGPVGWQPPPRRWCGSGQRPQAHGRRSPGVAPGTKAEAGLSMKIAVVGVASVGERVEIAHSFLLAATKLHVEGASIARDRHELRRMPLLQVGRTIMIFVISASQHCGGRQRRQHSGGRHGFCHWLLPRLTR